MSAETLQEAAAAIRKGVYRDALGRDFLHAVADLLDETATDLTTGDGGWDSSVYTAALAVARAYLGEAS